MNEGMNRSTDILQSGKRLPSLYLSHPDHGAYLDFWHVTLCNSVRPRLHAFASWQAMGKIVTTVQLNWKVYRDPNHGSVAKSH